MSRFRYVMAAGVLTLLVTSGIGFDARVHAAPRGDGIVGNCHALQALLAAASHMPDAALAHIGATIGRPDLTGRDVIDYLGKLTTEACN